jgi:hypothetical protein
MLTAFGQVEHNPNRSLQNFSRSKKMSKMTSGMAIAATAAALFASGLAAPLAHAADEATVKCSGINSCKGTSECKSAKNSCKGQNGCKGMGWVKKASADECKEAGGKVVK